MIDRDLVFNRQRGYCWFCGLPLPENYAIHHRKLRKHGGRDDPSNLIALHHQCHNLGTNSVHLRPQRSYDSGFLVPSWADPSLIPLRIHGGAVVLLHADGTTIEMKEVSHGSS